MLPLVGRLATRTRGSAQGPPARSATVAGSVLASSTTISSQSSYDCASTLRTASPSRPGGVL
ncbi:MAG: hypothetical protein BGO49_31340 [Planctomycetales bacterium 71-10]|nr:MAG: hypothetical protein BGO49_31340 [Planctomycetales bacterium 71-10]